jgi:hypothetical protein
MANEVAEVDPEKMQGDIEKMCKEIDAMNADADDICKEIQANAKLKDNIEKILKKT